MPTSFEDFIEDGCRLDDLQVNGLAVLQHPDRYCFTTDPVLLADFCKVNRSTRAADLGSGCGILGLLLVGKYNAAVCDCVELQPYAASMSKASAAYNRLENRIHIFEGRIQEAPAFLGAGKYDLVVSNPPYSRADDGAHGESEEIAIARHEIKITLRELVSAASKLVKYGGRFCLVHQAERLADVCAVLTEFGFAPKRIRLIEGREGLAPTLFLMDAVKAGGVGLHFLKTLVLYDKEGRETSELSAIYGRSTRASEADAPSRGADPTSRKTDGHAAGRRRTASYDGEIRSATDKNKEDGQ